MGKRMTARQRECQKIAEAKAKQQMRSRTLRRFTLLLAAIFLLYGIGGGFWFLQSGGWDRFAARTESKFFQMTADAGFTVQHVYLEGRRHTGMEKIEQALQLSTGAPILAFSPQALRARLESLDRVQYAEVERVLPSTLHIHIVEREPIAIWQNHGALRLIDNTGRIMEDVRVEAYAHLPVVVGENAPSHAPALFAMFEKTPELAKEITAAIRMGERRWNVRFRGGIEVKLPEQAMQQAWDIFARMQEKDKILDKAIAAVDLRMPGKVFLKLGKSLTSPQGDALISAQKSASNLGVVPAAARKGIAPSSRHET